MLNEEKFWVLSLFPLLKIPFTWLGLLEQPSTSIANNNIVLLCNNKNERRDAHFNSKYIRRERY